MNEECENQTLRKESIVKELSEVSETIEQLKETLDELNEKALRLDLNINQAVNQKLRLEMELKKYRKLGKQPKAQQAPIVNPTAAMLA